MSFPVIIEWLKCLIVSSKSGDKSQDKFEVITETQRADFVAVNLANQQFIAALKADMESLKQEMHSLKSENRELREQHRNCHDEQLKLKQRVSELETEVTELRRNEKAN